VAKYSSILPFKSGLGGNKHARAHAGLGDCPANDLLGSAESIDGGRVDDIVSMLQHGTDGGNRFSFIGSAPHPPANGPGADRDGRHLERCAGNVGKLHVHFLHVHFESFGLTSHDPAPSSSASA